MDHLFVTQLFITALPSFSHTTHIVDDNFIPEQWDLQFKVEVEWRIFEKFYGNFIYSQSFCPKSAEGKSPKKYSNFILLVISGLGFWTVVSRPISQHNTYYTKASTFLQFYLQNFYTIKRKIALMLKNHIPSIWRLTMIILI